jgi:signal peptidase II
LSKRSITALTVIFSVLLADQVSKILVKTNMRLYESFNVLGNWFQIYFIENPGMAFGMQWGGELGKYALTSFRLVAIIAIAWYIVTLIRQKAPLGFIVTMSLILSGAIGNVIDSLFYGIIFTDSYHQVAKAFTGNGYAPFMQGKVVDMLYFPIFNWPEWIPFLGGSLFFSPVFNIADAAITVGVFMIILFHRSYLTDSK